MRLMKLMGRQTLGMKALTGLFILAVLVIVSTCITIDIQYKSSRMAEYGEEAFAYARMAAEYIDGDRVLPYLETKEEDEYYSDVQRFLDITRRQANIKYFYVFVPYEDDLVYIWDDGEADGVRALGYREPYMKGSKAAVERVFRRNPPEEISIAQDEEYGYLASAYSPIFDSAGEPVAVVGVDASMSGIRKALFRFQATLAICICAVVVVSMAIFYAFIRKGIINPIGRLNEAAKNMVSNLEQETGFCPDIHTGDEIEGLSDAFAQMDGELRDYIGKLSAVMAEKERMGAELGVAKDIQTSMLPCIFPPFPERSEFDIHASMNPAKEVGGDFYDFFLVDKDHLALVMADVSGKGVPAALFMVIAKTLLKNSALGGCSPKKILETVNNQLCENNEAGMFVTVWIGILTISTGDLLCANAGHEYPVVRKADGAFELFRDKHGLVLAGMEGAKYQEYGLHMDSGDALFIYTDGVPEAMDENEELFGTDRMIKALNTGNNGCKELLEAVRKEIDAFVGEAPQFDDITMLCLEYRGSAKKEGIA